MDTRTRAIFIFLLVLAYVAAIALPAAAQKSTGVIGSPKATTTVGNKQPPMILQWDESFDVGSDTLTGVNDADYRPPFPLTAKLNKLTIKVDRPKLSPEDVKKLQAAMKQKAAND